MFRSRLTSGDRLRFQNKLEDGKQALREGRLEEARYYFNLASRIDPDDARAWVWLAKASTEREEQEYYYKRALVVDPDNGEAKRALTILREGLKPDEVVPVSAQPVAPPTTEAAPVQAQIFNCPSCGGLLKFEPQASHLRCQRCGTSHQVEARKVGGNEHEQSLARALLTGRAHHWPATHQLVSCGPCGASSLLPPDQASTTCAYCGSDQVVAIHERRDMIEPQALLPFSLDHEQAERVVRAWLGEGFFTPRSLQHPAQPITLRPAYYPFWTFDAGLNMPWSARVERGVRSGIYPFTYDDVLVAGTGKLSPVDVARLGDYPTKEVVEYRPEFLAGWAAIMYDCTLADASIQARGWMIEESRRNVEDLVSHGEALQSFTTGQGTFIELTYKHVLLPLWVVSYKHADKEYHLLLNDQTRRIVGSRPRDEVMVWVVGLLAVGGVLALLMSVVLLSTLG
jgi:tetratricopeptide (TPR) repeat protein